MRREARGARLEGRGLRLEAEGSRREASSGQWAVSGKRRRSACPSALHLKPQASSLKPAAKGRTRAGVTLLEVLISMFVLLVGLLGVASLIPVGKFEMQRGAKADRASACGRAAFREIKVRGMLNPRSWAQADSSSTAVFTEASGVPFFDLNDTSAALTNFRPLVIDPLGVGDPSGTTTLGPTFPWPGNTSTAPAAPLMPRITLGPGLGAAERVALADAIFRGQDDLVFDTPADEDRLPTQMLQGNARRLSQGDYSWLMTVVPDMSLAGQNNLFDLPYTVSVAVFYKRNLLRPADGAAAEGERICGLTALTGFGEITVTTSGAPALTTVAADHLKIANPGQWLMISGIVDPDSTDNDPNTAPKPFHACKWYRIVGAADIQGTGPFTRELTVAGPDWEIPPAKLANFISTARVYLFDGVIAVFEKNMKPEMDSMYQ